MDVVAGQISSAVASTNDRKNLGVRRRSVSDMKRAAADSLDAPLPTDPIADDSNGTPDMWLNEELEALGELKRGAIAAQFPEEFNVDSDILNGASNVWLPARLHPEIAPGEFQEWLKKHGSQLSKMEDSVHRRKSILSYSYNNNDGTDDPQQPEIGMRYSTDLNNSGDDALDSVDFSFGVGAGVRRRNTTGLVRRKTFIERADEEADEDAPFLVQGMQRSSLKRSKLANKRRDSTASRTGSGRRGRRNYDHAAPSVSSPLAPPTVDTAEDDDGENDDETATNNSNGGSSANAKLSHASRKQQHHPQKSRASAHENAESPDSRHPISSSFLSGQQQSLELTRDAPTSVEFDSDGKRMSTAEILKQVTAAVDNLGFDFEICDLDNYDDLATPEPSAPTLASINSADDKQQQQPYQMSPNAADQEKPATLERKSVAHKKSGSWWQWGRDDNATNGPSTSGPGISSGEKDARPPMSLPNTIQRPKQQPLQKQQQQPPQASANVPSSIKHTETMPAAPSSSLLKSKLPSPISFLRFNRKSKKDRRSSDGNQQQQQHQQQPTGIVQPHNPSNAPQPSQTKQQPLGLGPGHKKQQHQGPSAASAPTSAPLTASSSLQPSNAQQKRAMKDAQTNDDSGSTDTSSDSEGSSNGAAQKSNIPSIITPVRPPPTRLATSSNRLPIHIERAIYRLASIKLANPRRPLLQQVLLSNMMFWYLELINPRSQQQQQQTQQPPSPQQAQQQHQQAQPEKKQKSPKMTQTQPQQTPPVAAQQQQQPQQQQQQHQIHKQHHQKQQQHRAPSPEVGGMNGHHHGATDKRGKQRGHKSRDNVNRRRSAGTNNASEHVVMRSPQYERQQQQIYMYPQAGSQQQQQQQQQQSSPHMVPGGQPQQMKYNYQQPQQHMAGGGRSHSPVPSHHSMHSGDDEDDDVPLALYRGERNAMSIG